jgi:hypothetical protein
MKIAGVISDAFSFQKRKVNCQSQESTHHADAMHLAQISTRLEIAGRARPKI